MVTVPRPNPAPLSGGPGFRWLAGWLLLCLAFATLHSAMAGSFEVRAEPDSVAVGETVTLQLIFTDCGNVTPPQLPTLPNCSSQFAGTSKQYSISNGSASTSLTHQYVLRPTVEGVINIPALNVEVNGQRLTSNPVTVRVGKGLSLSDIGFVKVVLPKPTVYLGETFPLEVKFYFRQSPQEVAPVPTLKIDGFTINKQGQRQNGVERVGAADYSFVTWRMSVTPVKLGDLTVGPAEVETIFLFQARNRRRGPFDDPFFNSVFGGGAERRRLTFTSETNQIHVLPPPTIGRPNGFAGAVGRYSLEMSAAPTNVTAGDPITVRLKVQGRGNFNALQLPEFPAGLGFQAYPGTNSFEPNDELGLEGVKTFEVVLVPDSAEVKELRWPAFSFWDPDDKRYDTVEPRAIPLNVRAGQTLQAQPGGNLANAASGSPAPRPVANEFRPPETRLGTLVRLRSPMVAQPWFLGLLFAPGAAYLALGAVLRFRARPRDLTQTIRHQREMAQNAALRSLAEHAQAADAPAFFQALNTALQERLALTLGGTAGSFTPEVVETRLLRLGLPAEAVPCLHRLFAALDQARYSPIASTAALESLRTDAEAVDAALRKLEGVR